MTVLKAWASRTLSALPAKTLVTSASGVPVLTSIDGSNFGSDSLNVLRRDDEEVLQIVDAVVSHRVRLACHLVDDDVLRAVAKAKAHSMSARHEGSN